MKIDEKYYLCINSKNELQELKSCVCVKLKMLHLPMMKLLLGSKGTKPSLTSLKEFKADAN